MNFYDYHVHTKFSPDCQSEMEDIILKALSKEVVEICFTDHLDIDYPSSQIQFDLDYKPYLSEFNRVKELYCDKMSLKLGLELGLQPHVLDECKDYVSSHSFDFIIGSVHGAHKKDLFTGDFMTGKDKYTSYKQYLEEILLCISNFHDFSVLGHLDLIRRYGFYEDNSIAYIEYKDIVDQIFNTLVSNGKGIELNTSGYRYGLKSPHPTYEFIKEYKKMGGEIITIGSDSHYPEDIAKDFLLGYEVLKAAGFNHICVFNNMKPKFIDI